MNFQQACDWLIDHGAKEYSDRLKPQHARSFTWRRLTGASPCAHNERPPSLHVIVYAPYRPFPDVDTTGAVEFEVVGKAGDGTWLKAKIYSVTLDEMVDVLPRVEKAAEAVWEAFVGTMGEQEER